MAQGSGPAGESELRRVNRALRVLSSCIRAATQEREEASLIRAFCRAIVDQGGYPLAWVGFAQHDEEHSIFVAEAAGRSAEYARQIRLVWSAEQPSGQGPAGCALRTGEPSVCRDIRTDPRFAEWRETAARFSVCSSIGLPVRCGGEVVAVLSMYAAEPDAFDEQETALLNELANELGAALELRRHRAREAAIESSLRASEAEFRTLFENIADAVFIHSVEGRILEVNPAACRLGYSREELVRMTVNQVVADDQIPLVRSRIREVLDNGHTRFESVHLTAAGDRVPVEVVTSRFDYRGSPAVLSVARDISDRKRAEAALRETRHWLQVAVAASNIGLWNWHLESGRVFYSTEWKQQLGYTDDEISDDLSEWIDRVHPADRGRMDRILPNAGMIGRRTVNSTIGCAIATAPGDGSCLG
jgi:PAS domain S-box-containing protein